MHPHLAALAAHAHQHGFINGPMDKNWWLVGGTLAAVAAIVAASSGRSGRSTA